MRGSGCTRHAHWMIMCRLVLLLTLFADCSIGVPKYDNDARFNSRVVEDSTLIEKRSLKGRISRFSQSVLDLLESIFDFGEGTPSQTQVDDEICYEHVGCFSSGDRFTLPTSFPDNPDTVNTSLMLFSRTNRQDPLFLDYTFTSRQENISNWRTNRPLKIIVHGWRDNTNSSWIHDMKDALLQEEDCNVIIVDWSRGAKTLNYVFAAGNSALVGRQLSLLTQRLSKAYGLNASRVHCIGHSLGGHAAGFFGRHFKEKTGLLIGRISALDVAEPLFSDSGVSVSSEDAQFVDVIHTSEGHWYIRSGLGMMKPVGHVDFYPNFGERQPGCTLMDIICDHDRSVYYFMESITNKQCHFKSKPCDETSLYMHEKNCVGSGASGEMGYFSPHAAGRGVQYLSTNKKSLYCKNN